MDVIEAEPLDLMVDRAGDDVARRKLGALVESRHEARAAALTPGGSLSCPPSPRTASVIRKFLTSQIVEAGRVELHELHVGDAAARPPRHGDAVAGRAARRGRIEVGAARAAGGEDRRPAGQRFDPLLLAVVGVEAVDRAAGREMRRVAAGDEVDRDHVGHQRDVGMLGRRGFRAPAGPPSRWRRRHGRCGGGCARPRASGAARRPRCANGTPSSIRCSIARGAASTTCSTTLPVVEPRAGDHRVVDMGLEAVAFLEHRGDPALRPARRAFAERALGDAPRPCASRRG